MRIIVKAVYPESMSLADALLGGFKQVRVKALKNALKIGDRIYKNSSMKLLKIAEGKILKFLQDKLNKSRILINMEKLLFEKDAENSIRAVTTVKNIDYKELANRALPKIIAAAANRDSTDTVVKLAEILKEEQETIISSVLDAVGDEKKKLIISLLVEKYHSIICTELTRLAASSGMSLTIEEICIECEDEIGKN